MSKKCLPAGVRFLLGLISFVLCIALFACSLVTILVADLGLLTSKGGLQKLIQDVLFSTSAPARPGFATGSVRPGRLDDISIPGGIPGDIPVDIPDDLLSGIASGVMDGNVSGALVDALYGVLESQMGEDIPVTKEEVSGLIEQSTIPEFISDKVSGIVVDVINGEVSTTITKEDVMNLIQENKELIEDTLQTEIPEEVIESVGTMVEDSKISEVIQQEVATIVGVEPPVANNPGSDAGSDSNPGGSTGPANKPGALNKPVFRPGDLEILDSMVSGSMSINDVKIADILALVRIITAPAVLIGCIAVCLALSALLFLTNWGRPNAALRCSGITYFIAGLLFLIPSAVAQFVPSLFSSMGLAGNAIRQVLSLAGTISLGVTVFGLVLIVLGAVVGSVMKKKRVAAAAQTAAVTGTPAVHSEELLAETAEEAPALDDLSDLAATLLAAEEAPAAEETEV